MHRAERPADKEVAADLPQTCISDPLRLGQILINLLSNAVKFTEVGRITLSASRQDEELVFRVEDTGIGMSKDQLGQLFHPFEQADGSTTRKFGGTGLGLAITKRILDLMEGTIHVESQAGIGSSFEFRLPYVESKMRRAEPAADALTKETLPEKALAGVSILVAEDDPINQMVLDENLREGGPNRFLDRVSCSGEFRTL